MYWAKVGASSAYSHLLKNTRTTFLGTFSSMLLISAVVVLEFASSSFDIAVVGHRISAEIYTFFQSFFSGFEHGSKMFLRNAIDV